MSDALIDEIAHREKLAATLRQRQRILETQIALYGSLAVPTHILMEKEETERQLAQVNSELRRMRPGSANVPSPYMGLRTFQEADSAFLFGRDMLVYPLQNRWLRRSKGTQPNMVG